VLPFEHGRDGDGDIGLSTFQYADRAGRRDYPMLGRPDSHILEAAVTNVGERFMRLAQRLSRSAK